ncbi:MAG: peptidase S1, partial [Hydrogenophaga sp.]|nr:peptidase S1 [Hydrogenophaga sp.]
MRKPALYSPSARPAVPRDGAQGGETLAVDAPPVAQPAAPPRRWRASAGRAASSPRVMWSALALLAALLAASVWHNGARGPKALTQKDIDAAVLRTLTTQNLPSPAARAAEKIRPAVVR